SKAVTSSTPVSLTAAYGASAASLGLTVNPPAAATPPLIDVTVSPATVNSGTSSMGTVTLQSAAPSSGAVVQLFSSNAAAVEPAGQRHCRRGRDERELQRHDHRRGRLHARDDHRRVRRHHEDRNADRYTAATAARTSRHADGYRQGPQRRTGDVESRRYQRRRRKHRVGVVLDGNLDHAVGLKWPRCDLVRCMFEQRNQDEDLQLHAERHCIRDRERAVTFQEEWFRRPTRRNGVGRLTCLGTCLRTRSLAKSGFYPSAEQAV